MGCVVLKLFWLAVTHFDTGGGVLGYDAAARLEAAIDHINDHHGDAEFGVITGDLVERGSAEQYVALKSRLDRLRCRTLLIPGNHDDRASLKATFEMPSGCMDGFVQYAVRTGEGSLVFLDTLKAGESSGAFCAARAKWLSAMLDSLADVPAFLFMHHPPMRLGLPMQDSERLEDGESFLELLSGRRNVRHLFIGHVHRPVCGTVSGVPFATMRSALYQAPPPRPDWDWDGFAPAPEAPNLGVVTIKDGDVTLQYIPFCGHEAGPPRRRA